MKSSCLWVSNFPASQRQVSHPFQFPNHWLDLLGLHDAVRTKYFLHQCCWTRQSKLWMLQLPSTPIGIGGSLQQSYAKVLAPSAAATVYCQIFTWSWNLLLKILISTDCYSQGVSSCKEDGVFNLQSRCLSIARLHQVKSRAKSWHVYPYSGASLSYALVPKSTAILFHFSCHGVAGQPGMGNAKLTLPECCRFRSSSLSLNTGK